MIRIKLKIVLLTITITLFGLCASLLLLVGVDRVVGYVLHRGDYFKAMVSYVTIIWESNEFTFVSATSSQGLRNPEVTTPKPKGVYRILALGDSFTWGWGVNLQDTWVKKLETKLRETNPQVEVINAGVYGTSLTSQLAICEDYADRFDVDMILVGFYGTDDLDQELMTKRIFATEKVWAGLRILFPAFYKIRHPVASNPGNLVPYTVHYTQEVVRENAQKTLTQDPGLLEKLDPRVREDYLAGKLIQPWVVMSQTNPNYYISVVPETEFKQAVGAVSQVLQKMKTSCSKSRPLAFVFIPSMELVALDYHQYRNGLGFTLDPKLVNMDFDTPLSRIVEEKGFIYFSLLQPFREDKCPECFYLWDSHFTPAGNEKVAEFLKGPLARLIQEVTGKE